MPHRFEVFDLSIAGDVPQALVFLRRYQKMIYFLINNNFHLDLDLKLAKQLTSFELGLIQVPYSLNVIDKSDVFSEIYHFQDKINLCLRHPFKIFAVQKSVDKALSPNCNDMLLVHTDMDLLNQYIIMRFHQAKARIYLLEDGTATMCTYNIKARKALLKDRIKALILNIIYSYKHTKIGIYGIETLSVMDDYLFNGVIVNYGNSSMRDIPLYKLTLIKEPIEILFENGAIFLNQPLYLWYSTEERYISYMNDILNISTHFAPFYFKFHPSDTDSFKQTITKVINEQHQNIIIIQEKDIVENIILKYPIRYAVTFNSTAAMNLIAKGIVPIFLNHFYNSRFPDASFVAFSEFLKSIDCRVPTTLSDVKPGFCAFSNELSDIKTYSIADILGKP